MNHESSETINEIPQPEPQSDYYITWHKLYQAKYYLDKLVNYVADAEDSNTETDEEIEADLVKIISLLQNLLPKVESQ
ncbi:hypothetical protein FACHB389_15015 [Nostoc calcicola FACHB-389]|nr:hypothetical protein [Nostoc calcicola FACHB-3891]OKH34639.1 hypothetical protein FACHB389_15015 [Nostoc calcicola FACHB-389]